LTLQLKTKGFPMVVVVNMMDEARAQGNIPNLEKLAAELGLPVVPAAAVLGEGMAQLENLLGKLCRQGVDSREGRSGSQRVNLRQQANRVYDAVSGPGTPGPRLGRLDRWLTKPLTGMVSAGLILAAIWWVIGGLVADKVVGFTEGVVMNQWLVPLVVRLLHLVIPPGGLLERLLIGDFGVLTMALAYGIGLLLPLVFSFYLLLSLLEDSGYMPRLAVLLDNTFRPLGLNGKGVIPLILGFGCVTMAVISTRMLPTRRERIIMTFLLGLAVPCSAQTGVIAMMLVPMGLWWLLLYAGVLVAVFVGAGLLLNKSIPGKSTGLFLELPRLRLPRLGNMLRKSRAKSGAFLKDALPLFALGAVLITLLDYFGILASLELVLAPLTSGWLKLPPQVIGAFLMGMIRRDFGAAGLQSLALVGAQRFVALITMTLFVPCIATVLVAIKEHGLLTGILVWFGSLITALVVGGILALAL
jgi:ferrous iron transport protein B